MTEKSNAYTIAELIEMSQQNQDQDLIEELMPSTGYMIIGSGNGQGKSLEMLHLLHAFASKQDGNYHGLKTRKCVATYIALEDDEIKIGDRLASIRPQYDLEYEPTIHTAGNMYLDTTAGRAELTNIINAERANGRDIKMVIMDSLKYTIAGDYLRPHEAKKWSDGVKSISKELGVAFVFVHHTRKLTVYKDEPQDLLDSDRIKGAKDLVDHAEACVLMAVQSKVERSGANVFRNKTNIIAIVKARHAVTGIENLPIETSFDRKMLCWNGQKWNIEGKTVKIVSTKKEETADAE